MIDKGVLKAKLREYLLEILREEDDIQTIEACKKEALRVNGYMLKHGWSVKRCAEQWLRGLPINVDYYNTVILDLIYRAIGDELIDSYWELLGEIIAEEE